MVACFFIGSSPERRDRSDVDTEVIMDSRFVLHYEIALYQMSQREWSLEIFVNIFVEVENLNQIFMTLQTFIIKHICQFSFKHVIV